MLTEAKRRVIGIVMAGAIALALSGCYTMKTENVYHADGTVDSSVLVAMDDSVLAEQFPDSSDPARAFVDQATSSPEMDVIREQLGDHLTFEPYAQDGQSGMLMKMTGVTLDEVAELNASQNAPAGESEFTVADGRITLEYTADAKLMENYDEALSSLKDYGMDSSSLSEFVDFEARHTFPGPVVSTTIGKIDPENPNSVIITDLTDMNSAQHYTIVASDGSGRSNGVPVMWIVIGGLLALGAVAGVIVWRTLASRKGVAGQADEPGDTGALPAPTFEPEVTVDPIAPEEGKE